MERMKEGRNEGRKERRKEGSKQGRARCWCLIPIILAAQEAETGGSLFEASLGKQFAVASRILLTGFSLTAKSEEH
jgi:hypothetical protein